MQTIRKYCDDRWQIFYRFIFRNSEDFFVSILQADTWVLQWINGLISACALFMVVQVDLCCCRECADILLTVSFRVFQSFCRAFAVMLQAVLNFVGMLQTDYWQFFQRYCRAFTDIIITVICRAIAELLQSYCRSVVDNFLQGFCRAIAEPVQMCCDSEHSVYEHLVNFI